ncbi:MAG: type II toxin-antitoxin system PemK/MazF family toxin [Patescibacteria group bacterium]
MYSVGDVLLMKFHPGFGSELKKYRPALVINMATELADPRFVLVVPITTQAPKRKHPLEIELKHCPFLTKKSFALLWYPMTLDAQRVQHVLGNIPSRLQKDIQQRLSKMFVS